MDEFWPLSTSEGFRPMPCIPKCSCFRHWQTKENKMHIYSLDSMLGIYRGLSISLTSSQFIYIEILNVMGCWETRGWNVKQIHFNAQCRQQTGRTTAASGSSSIALLVCSLCRRCFLVWDAPLSCMLWEWPFSLFWSVWSGLPGPLHCQPAQIGRPFWEGRFRKAILGRLFWEGLFGKAIFGRLFWEGGSHSFSPQLLSVGNSVLPALSYDFSEGAAMRLVEGPELLAAGPPSFTDVDQRCQAYTNTEYTYMVRPARA